MVSDKQINLRQKLYNTKGDGNYKQVLEKAQKYISNSYSGINIDLLSEEQLRKDIIKYITNFNIKCNLTDDVAVLANYIFHDMSGFSFITRENLFDIDGFEEININSWDKIIMQVHGKKQDSEHRFLDAEHAAAVDERMLRKTGTTFNDATPRATAEIFKGIRICAERSPIIDEHCGVTASIRKVKIIGNSGDNGVVERGTLTKEMYELLKLAITKGVSICVSGETGAGKTTLSGGLLDFASYSKRIVTIEEDAREIDLVKRDETGKITNNVVHMKTRPSENPTQNITQRDLIKDALRLDPDILAPLEVRGDEAFDVMGAANTGHTIITSIHSNGTRDTLIRLITLAKQAYDMSDHTLLTMASRAFPLLVHINKAEDGTRKVEDISEVLSYENGVVQYQTLYKFKIIENICDEETEECIETVGEFERVSGISEQLAQRMLRKGARRKQLEKFIDIGE